MAPTAVRQLSARYARNTRFRVVLDESGDLAELGDFSIILFASVLHHIVDYESALGKALTHLAVGGSLLTFQDPMWYPAMPALRHQAHTAAYLAWRLTHRKDFVRGARNRLRRWLTRSYDPANPADMVEYHVLRQGVDQHRLAAWLGPQFERFSVHEYWSTPSRVLQRSGEALGLTSDFSIAADGFRGTMAVATDGEASPPATASPAPVP